MVWTTVVRCAIGDGIFLFTAASAYTEADQTTNSSAEGRGDKHRDNFTNTHTFSIIYMKARVTLHIYYFCSVVEPRGETGKVKMFKAI
jgi:hypothetical protein